MYQRIRLVLFLVSRTGPCNLLVPIKIYVPSSALIQELIDRVRRLKLLVPLVI